MQGVWVGWQGVEGGSMKARLCGEGRGWSSLWAAVGRWQGMDGWVGQCNAGLELCLGQGREAELLRAGQGLECLSHMALHRKATCNI